MDARRIRGPRLSVRGLVLMVAAIAVLCARPWLLFPTLFVGPLLLLLWQLRRDGWGYAAVGLLGAFLLVPALFLATVAFVAYTQIPPVYYADFRAIERRLRAHPGVRIVGSWKHEDVSLEDCGFTVQVRHCPPVDLHFALDHEDWRRCFRRIKAIQVSVGRGSSHWIPVEPLAEAGGPRIRNLPDLLDHMEDVLDHVRRRGGGMGRGAPPPAGANVQLRCLTRWPPPQG
jgi:hypothetical protein